MTLTLLLIRVCLFNLPLANLYINTAQLRFWARYQKSCKAWACTVQRCSSHTLEKKERIEMQNEACLHMQSTKTARAHVSVWAKPQMLIFFRMSWPSITNSTWPSTVIAFIFEFSCIRPVKSWFLTLKHITDWIW